MNKCKDCRWWDRKNKQDETAPEGICMLPHDPGFYPFGYWPRTLQNDGCGDGFDSNGFEFRRITP